jgi:PGF-pre-PGF domain-containing protein
MGRINIKKMKGVDAIIALSCFFFLLGSAAMPAPALADNRGISVDASNEMPDLTITSIKAYHYKWLEDYGIAQGDPWFDLTNYVNVTVKNNGTEPAESFDVKLYYADGDEIGSETVGELPAGDSIDVKFEWSLEGEGNDPLSWTVTPEGAKLYYKDTNEDYTLEAVVDEDNNTFGKEQEVVWNSYMADKPLDVYEHDTINGGVILTTGDGVYRSDDGGDSGTVYGSPYDINYELQIPGSTQLARFYVYYTWSEPKSSVPKAPKIGVTLETPSGDSHNLNLEQSYNDIKGDLNRSLYNYQYHAWGTYAYDITNYVQESGSYVVTVENLNDGSYDDFTDEYSFAAPAMLVVYENATAPKREYWINEGADILMGGRRPEGGFLGLEDCLNSAEFSGEHVDLEVEEAVLGVVSPWADDAKDDVIIFNGDELGEGLYNGYSSVWSSSEALEGISMHIGADEAQQGMAAIDVTRYLEDDDNEVVQGDDGDNMMPANAFLVITYKEGEEGDGAGSGGGGSSAKDTETATATPTPASAAPSAVVTKASRTIPLLEAGKEVAMIFQDMDVSMLALEADTDVSDAKVVVERINKPVEVTEPSGIPYVYLDISVEHEEETANIDGRIEFKVAKSWIAANNIAEVTLNRYRERDGWTALPTAKVGEEENATVYFEAETTGFSIFAITAEEKVVTASTPSPRTMPTPTAASTPPPAAHEETQTPEAGGASVPGFELTITLCMLFGGAYLLLIRKKNS